MFKSLTKLLVILTISSYSLISVGQNNQQSNRASNGNGNQEYGVISGAVHDKITAEHVEYANVILFSQRDSAMVTGTITDN